MNTPSSRILYLDARPDRSAIQSRGLAGVRRHARARGWDVQTIWGDETIPAKIPGILRSLRPLGCVVADYRGDGLLPPRLFGDVPVVYLDSPGRVRWRGAASVVCDNAAVARAAFRELAAGLPRSFAFVPSQSLRPWNAERRTAFRARCAEAGLPCSVFPGHRGEGSDERLVRLRAWVAKLPRRCAVFAANDNAACDVAAALAAAGRSVPRDCTIIGVDGEETTAEGGDASRISSIKTDFEQAGFLSVRLLADIVAGKAPDSARSAAFGPLLVLRRESTRGRGRREPRILEAVGMIRREACDGLTAAALAARFPGSRNLFERRFREAMGHSVLDEILHVRLQHVQTLLGRPEVPIGAIAAFSGFSSDRELRKLFLARSGVSMREWRAARLR